MRAALSPGPAAALRAALTPGPAAALRVALTPNPAPALREALTPCPSPALRERGDLVRELGIVKDAGSLLLRSTPPFSTRMGAEGS